MPAERRRFQGERPLGDAALGFHPGRLRFSSRIIVVRSRTNASLGSASRAPPPVLRRMRLFGAKLRQRAEPVLHVIGGGDLAVLDGLYIDCHDLEALAGV